MKISHSLKHTDGILKDILFGTEVTNGIYLDSITMNFLQLIQDGQLFWSNNACGLDNGMLASKYYQGGDKRFGVPPTGFVATFTQE